MSEVAVAAADALRLLTHLCAHAAPSFAFLSRVRALTVRHWQAEAEAPLAMLAVSVVRTSDSGRVAVDSKEWKKFSVSR